MKNNFILILLLVLIISIWILYNIDYNTNNNTNNNYNNYENFECVVTNQTLSGTNFVMFKDSTLPSVQTNSDNQNNPGEKFFSITCLKDSSQTNPDCKLYSSNSNCNTAGIIADSKSSDQSKFTTCVNKKNPGCKAAFDYIKKKSYRELGFNCNIGNGKVPVNVNQYGTLTCAVDSNGLCIKTNSKSDCEAKLDTVPEVQTSLGYTYNPTPTFNLKIYQNNINCPPNIYLNIGEVQLFYPQTGISVNSSTTNIIGLDVNKITAQSTRPDAGSTKFGPANINDGSTTSVYAANIDTNVKWISIDFDGSKGIAKIIIKPDQNTASNPGFCDKLANLYIELTLPYVGTSVYRQFVGLDNPNRMITLYVNKSGQIVTTDPGAGNYFVNTPLYTNITCPGGKVTSNSCTQLYNDLELQTLADLGYECNDRIDSGTTPVKLSQDKKYASFLAYSDNLSTPIKFTVNDSDFSGSNSSGSYAINAACKQKINFQPVKPITELKCNSYNDIPKTDNSVTNNTSTQSDLCYQSFKEYNLFPSKNPYVIRANNYDTNVPNYIKEPKILDNIYLNYKSDSNFDNTSIQTSNPSFVDSENTKNYDNVTNFITKVLEKNATKLICCNKNLTGNNIKLRSPLDPKQTYKDTFDFPTLSLDMVFKDVTIDTNTFCSSEAAPNSKTCDTFMEINCKNMASYVKSEGLDPARDLVKFAPECACYASKIDNQVFYYDDVPSYCYKTNCNAYKSYVDPESRTGNCNSRNCKMIDTSRFDTSTKDYVEKTIKDACEKADNDTKFLDQAKLSNRNYYQSLDPYSFTVVAPKQDPNAVDKTGQDTYNVKQTDTDNSQGTGGTRTTSDTLSNDTTKKNTEYTTTTTTGDSVDYTSANVFGLDDASFEALYWICLVLIVICGISSCAASIFYYFKYESKVDKGIKQFNQYADQYSKYSKYSQYNN